MDPPPYWDDSIIRDNMMPFIKEYIIPFAPFILAIFATLWSVINNWLESKGRIKNKFAQETLLTYIALSRVTQDKECSQATLKKIETILRPLQSEAYVAPSIIQVMNRLNELMKVERNTPKKYRKVLSKRIGKVYLRFRSTVQYELNLSRKFAGCSYDSLAHDIRKFGITPFLIMSLGIMLCISIWLVLYYEIINENPNYLLPLILVPASGVLLIGGVKWIVDKFFKYSSNYWVNRYSEQKKFKVKVRVRESQKAKVTSQK